MQHEVQVLEPRALYRASQPQAKNGAENTRSWGLEDRTVNPLPSKSFRKARRPSVCIWKTAHVCLLGYLSRSTATNLHTKGITPDTCDSLFFLSPPPTTKKTASWGQPCVTLTLKLWCHLHLSLFFSDELVNISIGEDANWMITNLNYEVLWTTLILLPSLKVTHVCTWAVKTPRVFDMVWGTPWTHLLPRNFESVLQAPGPHALATDDWIELCTWFKDRRSAEPIRFYFSGFWTGELRCSFLQWQEHPCVPGGWRVGDGGGERQRDERKERSCTEWGGEILSDETISPWIVRDAAGSFTSWLSKSQVPSRRTGCTSCPVGLWDSPYGTDLSGFLSSQPNCLNRTQNMLDTYLRFWQDWLLGSGSISY